MCSAGFTEAFGSGAWALIQNPELIHPKFWECPENNFQVLLFEAHNKKSFFTKFSEGSRADRISESCSVEGDTRVLISQQDCLRHFRPVLHFVWV